MGSRTPSTPRVTGLTLSNVAAAATNPMQQLAAPGGGGSSHPVEVVGRIRDHPDGRDEPSAIQVLPNGRDLRIRQADQLQYREFSLDGVSRAEDESLEAFYRKYAEARVEDVKGGGKCTIMMYGPTGAGKSHTMFGSQRERGVAYHALRQIMGEAGDNGPSHEVTVRASVWEIFNEEIFDLLAQTSNPPGSMKGASNRVKLVMRGHKVVNSTTQEDTDPNRLVKEIQKVEKRRVTKSTNCNDRSSRSHCVVTFEVPVVGGRLVLVDMAGSENIEQAGIGMDARMQTGKINQGNGALKRVVEAIAAQSDHIPYRDSKLTMLLQDSFETVNAKILMILCASPCQRDLYKTMGTFEYGAKAKTIVRLPNSPAKEKIPEADVKTLATMQARIAQKDVSIEALRREKESKEKEINDMKRRMEDIEIRINRKDDLIRELDGTKQKLEQLEREVELKEKEIEFQRSRADKAEAELNELKMSLKSDAKESGGRSIKFNKVDSPGSRLEKAKSFPERSSGIGAEASPKSDSKFSTPVSKKFSSSVLSFFRSNSDSQDQTKKSSLGQDESSKSKESPAQPGSSGDRKRKEQPSTLRDLLSRREEEQAAKTLKSSQEPVVREKPVHLDTPQNWFTGFNKSSQDVMVESDTVCRNTPRASNSGLEEGPVHQDGTPQTWYSGLNYASVVTPPSNELQIEPESMVCDSSPEEKQTMDTSEEMAFHMENDPLGLGTWGDARSEARLHRRGWLPIIIEEQEDDGEDTSTARPFASCPRFTNSSTYQKFIPSFSANTLSSTAEPTSQNLYREKFLSEGEKRLKPFEKCLEAGGAVQPSDPTNKETESPKEEEMSEVDALIGRLTPVRRASETLGTSGREEPELESADATARKARIENIFMLCGHIREVKSRSGTGEVGSPICSRSSPSPKSTPDEPPRSTGGKVVRELYNSFQDSPTQPRLLSPVPTGGKGARELYNSLEDSPPQPRLLSPMASPLSSFRGNQSHLCLEVDGYYSPASKPSHRVTKSFDETLFSQENLNSYLISPLPVLPSPQKSDSPARHRKFRNGNLFAQHVTNDLGSLTGSTLDDIQSTSPVKSRLGATPGAISVTLARENELSQTGGVPAVAVNAVSSNDFYANENVPAGNTDAVMLQQHHIDVYVKWESSKESSGKQICVLKVAKGSTLEELRNVILPHIAAMPKHAFSFLMLGDQGGAPVERDLESDIRVSSLPEGPGGHNSLLASLRPPAVSFTSPSKIVTPFRSIENQLTTPTSLPPNSKLPSKFTNFSGPNSTGKLSSSSNNSSSLVKGLRTLANGVGIRSGSTVK
ncbi:hypothetical protein R1flu_024741 [Riccia fluitans]|uniref:Kinesin motor domain-containing protein n=1 Tax=Riccia fluitans TaxID=41844 RepID=A0ABD1XW87_9MARC